MAQSLPGLCDNTPQREKCSLGSTEVDLPISLLEDVNVFLDVVSIETWHTALTDAQRKTLMQFLPSFPKNDAQEKQITLGKLFAGENFYHGTPLRQGHAKMKEGMMSPDIARYATLCRKAKMREYRYQQQVYYSTLLKDILVNRQRILEQVYQTPINEPLQLKVKVPVKVKEQTLTERVQRRYARILREVNEECGAETSDEEETSTNLEGKVIKPVCKPLFPDSPTDNGQTSNVVATFAPKPLNGQPPSGGVLSKPRPRSPLEVVEVTEDRYRELLLKHRKRRADRELHPELDTRSLTLQDIVNRALPAKKALMKLGGGPSPGGLLKKKLKDKSDKKKKRIKVKEEEGEPEVEPADRPVALSVTSSDIPQDESAMDCMEMKDETDPTPLPTSHLIPTAPGGQNANFFSLLRDFICEDQDGKTTTTKLEERIREWQETVGPSCFWFTEQAVWVDLVAPALKFLSGDVLGLTLENFIPLLDYKERAQQWKWIGRGRDSDAQLHALWRHWLDNRDDTGADLSEGLLSSPPAPKTRTTFVVRPTNDEEKSLFQKQEYQRFSQPHRAFTYLLHGYSSVVGPVKGVYAKESTMNKARDHVLLVKERPPYVTILTLVRDAAARLPNGEGTRGDICELLKDSQFLAPGVTDAQINNVVSGALDRLHYEKDPCVKYDVNRKLWIYLHRNRTEDEFERIHQAQGAAAKAKKALQKPKPARKIKESVQAMATGSQSQSNSITLPESPVKVEPSSPGAASASPRAHVMSPRASQLSPRTSSTAAPATVIPAVQASPKQTTQVKQQLPTTKLVTTTSNPLVASPKLSTASSSTLVAGAPKIVTASGSPATPTVKPAAQTVVSLQAAAASNQLTAGQAAQVAPPLGLAQQLGVGKTGSAMTVIGGTAATKPLSLAFLQPSVAASKVAAPAAGSTPGTPPVVGGTASKPLAFSLIQSPLGSKVSESSGQGQAQGQTRTVVLTSKGETIGQKLLLTQHPHQQLQQQQIQQQIQQQLQQHQQQQQVAVTAGQARSVISSPKPPKTPSPAPASSPVTLVTTSMKGSSTKVVQQVVSSAGHVVSNMGLASLQKQITTTGSTTIKIQGGSILQSSGSKPLTIQRMASLEGAEVKGGQVILQRSPSVEAITTETATATTVLQQVGTAGSSQLTISRPGGKPATLVFTKPAASIAGKPSSSVGVTTVSSNLAAQLIQTTSIGGKPVTFGGKPIIIGGKPVQLSGKPIQIGGKPVHLIGKPGGGQIGVIQGQGGMVSALNIVSQASSGASNVPISTLTSVPQARLITTPTATAPTLVGQILQSGGAVVQAGRTAGSTTVSTSKASASVVSHINQHKVVSAAPSSAGSGSVVVTQLTPAAQAAKQGPTTTTAKLVSAGAAAPANVIGHQILVAPGSSPAKVVNTQHLLAATGAGIRPTLLTRSPGGKPASNIQVVKTMLSQASGGKPGQTTIVLAQPGGQQVAVTGVEQAGVKTVQTSMKNKGGPVYARIITPPPGIRLAAVRPGTPVAAMPAVSVLQAVGGRLQGDAQIVAQGQVATVATSAVTAKTSGDPNGTTETQPK